MASLSKFKDGRMRVEWYDGEKRRQSVSLGSIPERQAERIRDKIGQLVQSMSLGLSLDDSVAKWLSKIDDRLHKKLVRKGLADARVEAVQSEAGDSPVALGQFIDDYIDKRTDVKEATKTVYRQVRRNLVEHFGAEKDIAEITPGDADDFARYLKSSLPSPVTANRRFSLAKTMFRSAVRHQLIPANPFVDIKVGARNNTSRQRFIERADIDQIIDKAPDAEWRLMIALARFGGLRMPSEVMMLRWTDVNWERSRFTVHASKTEHHEGKETRTVPIFPELRPLMEEVWEQAEDGCEFVIAKHRPESLLKLNGNWESVNFRTQFTKIIKRAGKQTWPRLWQNLRSSRETELSHEYPMQVVTEWLGNSHQVAMKHYLQVTESDFERASAPVEKRRKNRRCTASHEARTDSQGENDDRRKPSQYKKKRPHARTCDRCGWRITDLNLNNLHQRKT